MSTPPRQSPPEVTAIPALDAAEATVRCARCYLTIDLRHEPAQTTLDPSEGSWFVCGACVRKLMRRAHRAATQAQSRQI